MCTLKRFYMKNDSVPMHLSAVPIHVMLVLTSASLKIEILYDRNKTQIMRCCSSRRESSVTGRISPSSYAPSSDGGSDGYLYPNTGPQTNINCLG